MTGMRESNAGIGKDRAGSWWRQTRSFDGRRLCVASADEKNAGIAEMLKKAGATPPLEVDAATLQSYAGKYKGDPGPEITIAVKDGKLFATGLGRGELRIDAAG